ncbi:hypothetical protein BHM03_00058799 [Ensete ventricosum]|nr:hypothetical protein BHM03_00058799 [Ensete ventricosum]
MRTAHYRVVLPLGLFPPRYYPKSIGNDRFRPRRSLSGDKGRFRVVSAEGGRKNEEGEGRTWRPVLLFARGRFLLPSWGEGTR